VWLCTDCEGQCHRRGGEQGIGGKRVGVRASLWVWLYTVALWRAARRGCPRGSARRLPWPAGTAEADGKHCHYYVVYIYLLLLVGRRGCVARVRELPAASCWLPGVKVRREVTHGGGLGRRDMFFCVCCVARSDACESEDAG